MKAAAWKCREDKKSWVLRLYHCSDQPEKGNVTADKKIQKAEITDILERPQEEICVREESGNQIEIIIPQCSIRTIRLTF